MNMGSDPQSMLQDAHNRDKQTVLKETAPRTCANCACQLWRENEMNKLEKQMFCRRNTPTAAQMRAERPRLRDGKVVIDKRTNKPEMENVMTVVYLYQPTMPELVCFDGWRPLETLPGEKKFLIDGAVGYE
jgi:hypothetical protein